MAVVPSKSQLFLVHKEEISCRHCCILVQKKTWLPCWFHRERDVVFVHIFSTFFVRLEMTGLQRGKNTAHIAQILLHLRHLVATQKSFSKSSKPTLEPLLCGFGDHERRLPRQPLPLRPLNPAYFSTSTTSLFDRMADRMSVAGKFAVFRPHAQTNLFRGCDVKMALPCPEKLIFYGFQACLIYL